MFASADRCDHAELARVRFGRELARVYLPDRINSGRTGSLRADTNTLRQRT